MRLQFDAVGLTEEKGWDEEKIIDFMKTPNWFSRYSWNKKTSDACYQEMMRRKLIKKRDVIWHDSIYGWKDEED